MESQTEEPPLENMMIQVQYNKTGDGDLDKTTVIVPEGDNKNIKRDQKKSGTGSHKTETKSSSKITSNSHKKILQINLEAARKQAEIDKKLIKMEMELKLAELGSQYSEMSKEMSYKEKVNDWLDKKELNENQFEEITNTKNVRELSDPEKRKLGVALPAAGIKERRTEAALPEAGYSNMEYVVEKLLTRQTIKDLPNFSGDPEEWPLFISQFTRSTKSCGFSEDENLARLQKCLHGKARDVVKPLLISCENLVTIMETLKMTFGRADVIINMLIDKAKRAVPPNRGKTDSLVTFSNIVTNLTSTIEVLNAQYHFHNPTLLDELLGKLPYFLRLEWGEQVVNNEAYRNLKYFSEWLKRKAKVSCLIGSQPPKLEDFQKNYNNPKNKNSVFSISKSNLNEKKIRTCLECGDSSHILDRCGRFKKKTLDEKWKIITENKLCICCLKPHHFKSQCYKKVACGIDGCKMIHHPLLHNPESQERRYEKQLLNHGGDKERVNVKMENECSVLLKFLPIVIKGPKKTKNIFAFFDDGSTTTLIDAELAHDLDLDGISEPICYQWTNGVIHQENSSKKVDVLVKDMSSLKFFELKGARTVKNLNLPAQSVNMETLRERYPSVDELREINSYFEKRPLILIGQDNCHLMNPKRIVEVQQRGPILSKTQLGWVIHGRNPGKNSDGESFVYHICNNDNYKNLHEMVKNSFSVEDFGVKLVEKLTKTNDDQRCEEIMENTTRRIGNRFETGLLWKEDVTQFPNNTFNALGRLYCIEKKMDQDKEFAEKYILKIEEYLKKGYARKMNEDENRKGLKWYLSHFGVVNPNKPKLRLVFDAAAETRGVSLNSKLLSGPDLLRPLISVLLTFRQNKIAFIGDIKEMFHQVVIRNEDRAAQHFLWRGRERKKDPEIFEMCVMTFGATCSPCLAQYIKNRNAKENEKEFPAAAKAIIKKHYVDDYLDSKSNEKEAIQQLRDVIEVHKRGGFEICNFASNSLIVLESIPENLRTKSVKNLTDFNENSIERVLGMKWIPDCDEFIFSLEFGKVNVNIVKGNKVPTKREILKFAKSVFDPLGFLGSILITIKILLQEIWRMKIGWDDEIPKNLFECWQSWISSMQITIPTLKIRRCYGKNFSLQDSEYTEIHSFCDSSEKAFCAAVYIRFNKQNEWEVSLIASKTRVAPLKCISIPRLELQAALLASRLVNTITAELEININKKFFWTDSRTVLQWIKADYLQYKTFVSLRVGEIRELTNKQDWHWVSTIDNVADEGTRLNKEAVISDRWLIGPHYLKNENLWPEESETCLDISEEELEIKKIFTIHPIEEEGYLPDIKRFSTFEKLVRTTAWVMRFIRNTKKEKWHGSLTVEEILGAETIWFREVQRQYFTEEIEDISKNEKVKKNSRIFKLSPFLDEGKLLYMKGRIWGAVYNEELNKNLIILDTRHRFTHLLIENYHRKSRHNGYEYVVNEIRQKFWIPRLRNAVKKVWKNCQFCKNRRAKPVAPEMGEVPAARMAIFKNGVRLFRSI